MEGQRHQFLRPADPRRHQAAVWLSGRLTVTDATFAAAGTPVLVRRRSIALATLCTVLFLTFLDTTIVSVALASIQNTLHAGVSGLQWVVGAYALTFASAMLIFGVIGDQF